MSRGTHFKIVIVAFSKGQFGRKGCFFGQIETSHSSVHQSILETGFGAGGVPAVIKVEQMPMTAHPSLEAAGDAEDKAVVRHVPGDDRAGGDEGVAAESDAADDGGIRADGGAAADQGPLVEAVPFDLTAGIGDISQDAGGAQEDVIFNFGARVDGDVVLHFDVGADFDIVGNHGVLAKDAVAADHRAGTNVGEVPDFGVFSDDDIIVNNGGGVNKHGGELAEGDSAWFFDGNLNPENQPVPEGLGLTDGGTGIQFESRDPFFTPFEEWHLHVVSGQ